MNSFLSLTPENQKLGHNMLPNIDFVRCDDFDYLLMRSEDHISQSIRKNGVWGQLELTLAKTFVFGKEDTIVIDAGANLGAFSIPIAKAVSDQNGCVYSFEPQRIIFQQLCANIFCNRLDNVQAFNLALGSELSIVEIPELDFHKSKNTGGFSINSDYRDRLNEEAKYGKTFPNYFAEGRNQVAHVPVVPIDNFQIFKNVAFIKVDVEGFELEFFHGAGQTLEKNNFPPIIFEVWRRDWFVEKAEETKRFLRSLGYNLYDFGEETLAQHRLFDREVSISREGRNFQIRIIR